MSESIQTESAPAESAPAESVDALADRRRALVAAMLPHVGFDGWSAAAMAQAARDLGWDAGLPGALFPAGPAQAARFYLDEGNRRMTEAAQALDLSALRIPERIARIIRIRLELAAAEREANRRAMTLLALPAHAAEAAALTWATADQIWWLAGDRAADFSWYSKRATLAAIYAATVLYWLNDESESHAETWDFLDRRLAGAAAFGKWRRKAGDAAGRLRGLIRPATA